MYYVYVIKSLRNNRFYIGSTSNLQRRLIEHNTGRSKYTKLTKPFKLLHTERYSTRSEAVRRELVLKSDQGRQWLKQKYG